MQSLIRKFLPRLIASTLLLFVLFANAATAELSIGKEAPLSQKPFWRSKPALLERMRNDREVIVSVRRETVTRGSQELQNFTMNGGGYVSRPKDFCFTVSQRYDELKNVSDHFKTVQYTPSTQQLFLITSALGWQARMLLQMEPVTEDWRSELQWEVIWGHFKGMKGLIGFEKLDERQTEISLKANYEAKELPLPKILMSFALEVITKKVAEKMRIFIESQPVLAAEETPEPQPTPALNAIRLPKGFQISVFADDVAGARQMALSANGTLFVGSRETGSVYAIPQAVESIKKNEKAKKAVTIARNLNEPNGVAFHKGSLYVAEVSRITRYEGIESKLTNPPKPKIVRDDYPTDKWHGWKYIAVGPDGWLYVPVGAPCNLCVNEEPIYASLTRISLDGKKREIYAKGIRNTVGFDWHPSTKELWFTDNGADMMGDDKPNDELNRAAKSGLKFGYPYCHQGEIVDPKFGSGKNCADFEAPKALLGAHVAALGMKFYRGSQFPREYKNRIFIAQHGSWNRSKKSGYRIVTVELDDKDKAKPMEVFAEGWLQNEKASGRPVDLLEMPDGSLLVSDDQEGRIYRILYEKPRS